MSILSQGDRINENRKLNKIFDPDFWSILDKKHRKVFRVEPIRGSTHVGPPEGSTLNFEM